MVLSSSGNQLQAPQLRSEWRSPSGVALASGAGVSSCRIRMVPFASAAVLNWSRGSVEELPSTVPMAGVMALPAELADALEDGQLDLFR